MGIGRFLWRATGIGHNIDTAKNIVKERSLIKGVKKTIKEDFARITQLLHIFIMLENLMEKKMGINRHLKNMRQNF